MPLSARPFGTRVLALELVAEWAMGRGTSVGQSPVSRPGRATGTTEPEAYFVEFAASVPTQLCLASAN